MTIDPRMESIEELSRASSDDEDTLAFPVADRVFAFHGQQAVEKLLKILITAHDKRFPFTHNIGFLISILEELGERVPATPFVLTDLTVFAGGFRYTDPDELTPETRSQIRETVRIVREHVTARVTTLVPKAGDNPA